MFAFRKSDLASFPCDSRDVCRIEDGSTNAYLNSPRILEDYLSDIEPNYSDACSKIGQGRPDYESILILSGFIAFVIGCSPTSMRLGAIPLSKMVRTEAELLERMGEIEPAPPELGGKTLTELLDEGLVIVDTDEKFPQSMGISGLPEQAAQFASFRWEIILNSHAERHPFVTSDFPASIEPSSDPQILNRVVPLRPDLAVRIHPQLRPPNRPNLATDFRYRVVQASPSEVTSINRTTIRCAEQLVFSPIDSPGLRSLVKRNSRYFLDVDHFRTPSEAGYLLTNRVFLNQR